MHLTLDSIPFLRDGQRAILAAAWLDLPAWQACAQSDLPHFAAQAALVQSVRFDAGLLAAEPAHPDQHAFLAPLSAALNLPLFTAASLPPVAQTWPELRPHAASATSPARGEMIVAWARLIASGAHAWRTNLFATPGPASDPQPRESCARTLHRLQSFARKQSDLLLRSRVVADPAQFILHAAPPRLELSLRQLPGMPVWTLFVINPSPHLTAGDLKIHLAGRDLDLGRLRLPAERFTVLQITTDRPHASRGNQPPPELPRKKGQRKADHQRAQDLLKSGIRVRTLFRATQV